MRIRPKTWTGRLLHAVRLQGPEDRRLLPQNNRESTRLRQPTQRQKRREVALAIHHVMLDQSYHVIEMSGTRQGHVIETFGTRRGHVIVVDHVLVVHVTASHVIVHVIRAEVRRLRDIQGEMSR